MVMLTDVKLYFVLVLAKGLRIGEVLLELAIWTGVGESFGLELEDDRLFHFVVDVIIVSEIAFKFF